MATVLDMKKIKLILTEICFDANYIIDTDDYIRNKLYNIFFSGILSDSILNVCGFVVYKLKKLINNLYKVNTEIKAGVTRYL